MKLKESIFSRRSFLNGFLGFGFLGLLGYILYPIKKFLLKGLEYEDPKSVSVPEEEIRNGIEKIGYHIFMYGKREAIVFSDERDGRLKAFFATCTHADCTVRYVPKEKKFWCACHNGYYDIDGKVIEGPPPKPLRALDINKNQQTGQLTFSIQA
jgi:Rieske Fe-S protein